MRGRGDASRLSSSNRNGVISSPHWEVWATGIGNGGWRLPRCKIAYTRRVQTWKTSPPWLPGPAVDRGRLVFWAVSYAHLGPPLPDPCGLPGNPRGPLSAHEFRVRAERLGAGRPQLFLLPPAASARSPGAARLCSCWGRCWPGRLAGSRTRPGTRAAVQGFQSSPPLRKQRSGSG